MEVLRTLGPPRKKEQEGVMVEISRTEEKRPENHLPQVSLTSMPQFRYQALKLD